MQSVPTITKVVSSNPTQAVCTRHNIVSDLRQDGGDPVTTDSSTDKTDHHDITVMVASDVIHNTP